MNRVVLSGGGTAGHINPALSLAEKLRDRGCEVYFAGTPTGIESRLAPQAGLPYKAFDASGFRRSHPLTMVTGIAKIISSARLAKKWFSEVNPDVVVGFGGYVSIPVSLAAEDRHIPVVIHEQNSVMGMANRFLSKRAQAVCVTYESSAAHLPDKEHVYLTGNPVRSSVLDATREEGRAYLSIPQDARMLLIFGGSGGARSINQAAASVKESLLARHNLYVLQITGPKEFDRASSELALTEEEAKRWQVKPYEDNMSLALAATDMILSRSGATSLAEISARAIPALLVPYPYATEDHQTTNAREYVDAGAAYILPDGDLGTPAFPKLLSSLVDDADVRDRMRHAASAFGTVDAAEKLADIVMAQVNSPSLV